MFRKFLLSTLAAGGLLAAVVAPTQAAAYHHGHHEAHHRYGHSHRAWAHREFCNWGEANAWIGFQRAHGFECYYQWHGANCWVFYR